MLRDKKLSCSSILRPPGACAVCRVSEARSRIHYYPNDALTLTRKRARGFVLQFSAVQYRCRVSEVRNRALHYRDHALTTTRARKYSRLVLTSAVRWERNWTIEFVDRDKTERRNLEICSLLTWTLPNDRTASEVRVLHIVQYIRDNVVYWVYPDLSVHISFVQLSNNEPKHQALLTYTE